MTATAPVTTAAAVAVHRFRSMGTDVTVVLPKGALRHANDVEAIFDDWSDRFTRFAPSSELMHLNRHAGMPVSVSPAMLDAVDAAVAAASSTDGLFDPLLGSRMAELGYDRTFDLLPVDRPAASLRPWHAGEWRSIRIDRGQGTVTLPAGAALDLGGLAKGMAVDAALDALADAGMSFAAVNAGGDLAVHGLPPDEEAWSVAVEEYSAGSVRLSSGALATSSVLRRRWTVDGYVRHHLLDPRTGMPVENELAQVSVAAGTCRQAEVAAKAVLLLGATGGAHFIEQHGLAALLITRRGEELRLGVWT
jgi:thiamine biosynthesis lipoprotein